MGVKGSSSIFSAEVSALTTLIMNKKIDIKTDNVKYIIKQARSRVEIRPTPATENKTNNVANTENISYTRNLKDLKKGTRLAGARVAFNR